MVKKAFDFNSTVDSCRLSTLAYHSAHGVSNIPPNIQRILNIPCRQTAIGWPTVDSGACSAFRVWNTLDAFLAHHHEDATPRLRLRWGRRGDINTNGGRT
eukprot:71293-Prorocentrum_minimum.AAC.1